MNGLSKIKAKKLKALLRIRERLIWRIGEETGLRISDILNLNKKDILSGKWTTREKKTGKIKKCSISADTIDLAKTYMTAYPTPRKKRIFINMETGKPFTRQSAYKNIKSAGKRLKMRRIGPHSSRATFAQNLKKDGLSTEQIQKALNHAKTATTKIYLRNKRK